VPGENSESSNGVHKKLTRKGTARCRERLEAHEDINDELQPIDLKDAQRRVHGEGKDGRSVEPNARGI
jgi:hypothetical protein